MRTALFIIILLASYLSPLDAQPVLDIIKKHPAYAACNYNTYPDSLYELTPAPKGKHPFYISHYGRHGSRYINNPSGYNIPYAMMLQAENVDELTTLGKKVLAEMNTILKDSEQRWGELATIGGQQHKWIAQHMMKQFPEVFESDAWIEAKSTIIPRCIVSMGTEMNEFAHRYPNLEISQEASKRDMWYMNHQDPDIKRGKLSPEAQKAYNKYMSTRTGNSRLMELIFKNPDIVNDMVDETDFNYYLMKMGLFQLNTHLYQNTFLIDIFQPEELYRMWQIDNALWYAQYANFTLNNGGQYPYTQRHLLRKIISDADSCLHMERHGAQLRFGHETVLLPLICLLGINGYDLRSSNLDEIESKGWWCSDVFPMAANLQFVFYRSSPQDKDILFKVLLNEQEARLPIATDCAPYYHWRDFRRHYLKKINNFEKKNKKKK
jgi:hypothetical protein